MRIPEQDLNGRINYKGALASPPPSRSPYSQKSSNSSAQTSKARQACLWSEINHRCTRLEDLVPLWPSIHLRGRVESEGLCGRRVRRGRAGEDDGVRAAMQCGTRDRAMGRGRPQGTSSTLHDRNLRVALSRPEPRRRAQMRRREHQWGRGWGRRPLWGRQRAARRSPWPGPGGHGRDGRLKMQLEGSKPQQCWPRCHRRAQSPSA